MSIEVDIMDQIKTRLLTLSWIVTVEYEFMHNLFGDFNESEMPAIQIYDRAPATVRHQNRYIEVEWPLAIELVMKSSSALTIAQADLFTKKRDMENIISADLHLGGQIEGFRHLRYDGFETDLHSTPGFFAISLNMTALYQQPFPGG